MNYSSKKFLLYFSAGTLIFSIMFFPNLALGDDSPGNSSQSCSLFGFTVVTINGMFTSEHQAVENMNALRGKLPNTFKGETLYEDYLYNPTHIAGVQDVFDAAYQKLFEEENVRDYDLGKILSDASRKLFTRKILLVGHSQGNFYANSFYNILLQKNSAGESGVPAGSLGVYGVAVPASYIAGGGSYITSSTDSVINALRLDKKLKILPANVNIPSKPEDGNGHSFIGAYLKYASPRITADIKRSLAKLSSVGSVSRSVTSGPCIPPPELNLGDKIAEKIFAVVDPAAEKEKAIIMDAAKGIKMAVTGADKISRGFAGGVLGFSKIVTNAFDGINGRRAAAGAASPNSAPISAPRGNSTETPAAAREHAGSASSLAETYPAGDFATASQKENSPVLESPPQIASNTLPNPAEVLPKAGISVAESSASGTDIGAKIAAALSSSSNSVAVSSAPVRQIRSGWGGRSPGAGNSAGGHTESISKSSSDDGNSSAVNQGQSQTNGNSNPNQTEDHGASLTESGIEQNQEQAASGTDSGISREQGGGEAASGTDTGISPGQNENQNASGTDTGISTGQNQNQNASGTDSGVLPGEDTSSEPAEPDVTPPVITLKGKNPTIVLVGSSYTEQGATARDDINGDVPVSILGASEININVPRTYLVTYRAEDESGNQSETTRIVKVTSYKYEAKYSFGSENGDGRQWQVWAFNGSNIYDWSDTYIGGYLREHFKIQAYSDFWCSNCLQRGIFRRGDPRLGFQYYDLSLSYSNLEKNPQNNMNNKIYDVNIQWDSGGYSYEITVQGEEGGPYASGRTDVPGIGEDTWVAWDGSFNSFRTFPSGNWLGIPFKSPEDRQGGSDMILVPYPVIQPPEGP